MERRTAIITAGITAASLTVGGIAYAAGSGLVESDPDDVGKLRPVAGEVTQPITLYVDPATGATTPAPEPTPVEYVDGGYIDGGYVDGGDAYGDQSYSEDEHEDEDHEDEEHDDEGHGEHDEREDDD